LTLLSRLKTCDGTLRSVVEAGLQGSSAATQRVRGQIVDLCADPLARGALLVGPPGTGKSTWARLIALGRYIALLKPDHSKAFLSTVTIDGPSRISLKQLPWYVEQPLPGLVGELAQSQLFGHEKGAFTGATSERPGVFENASLGRGQGSRGTLGVVLLDEIGDLDPALQPKLLAVLAGADVHRLGGEHKEGFQFRGLTIAATWQDVFDDDVLRRDLRERLSDHIINVPSLSERLPDLDILAEGVLAELREQVDEWWKTVQAQTAITGLDRARGQDLADRAQNFSLQAADLETLRKVDWTTAGEMRGLVQTIKKAVFGGQSILELANRLGEATGANLALGDQFLREMVRARNAGPDQTVSALAKTVYSKLRQYVAETLLADATRLQQTASALGLEPAKLKRELYDLRRGDRGE
jgi:DNA-binding NtrC family response regulator